MIEQQENPEQITLEQHNLIIAASKRYPIKKLTVINRLITAGMLGVLDQAMTDSIVFARQWEALDIVYSDDVTINQTLNYFGADIKVILAPEQT